VYDKEALGRSAAFKWQQRFARGRDSLEEDECSGRPKAVRTERKIKEVAMLVRANCSQSIDDIAAAVGISHDTCHKILTDDLNMSCVTEHCVPCCCYTTTPLHIALFLSKRNWQGNRSPFCHTLRIHLISHHAISFSFTA
jgi:hypothetical protein